ncbi:thioesterase family protein [Leisingera sp. D0M16]|uniref:thioesterase family protein n=1 Tax=Leisingera coralii TaxID=3351347 RepID=UPI003B7A2ED3
MALAVLEDRVPPEWSDYNGHMSAPYFAVAFGAANDQAMEVLGLGCAYREHTGNGLYVVEARYTYRIGMASGDAYRVSTWLGGADDKRLSLTHRLTRSNGQIAAEAEILFVHVDRSGPRAVAFDSDLRGRLTGMSALAHLRSPAA